MDFPGEKLVIRLWETLAEKGLVGCWCPGKSSARERRETRSADKSCSCLHRRNLTLRTFGPGGSVSVQTAVFYR